MKLPDRWKLSVGFGLAMVIMVAFGWMSYRSTARFMEDSSWVAHTHEVLKELAQVLSEMKDAETGQRGYLITGEERYLEPYDEALAKKQKRLCDCAS